MVTEVTQGQEPAFIKYNPIILKFPPSTENWENYSRSLQGFCCCHTVLCRQVNEGWIRLDCQAENGTAMFMKESCIHMTESVHEQAEHCLTVLDKTQVKKTLVGKSLMETELIVLGLSIVIFHFFASGLLSPCLSHGCVWYVILVTLPSVRRTVEEGRQAQCVERGSALGI